MMQRLLLPHLHQRPSCRNQCSQKLNSRGHRHLLFKRILKVAAAAKVEEPSTETCAGRTRVSAGLVRFFSRRVSAIGLGERGGLHAFALR